MRNYWLKIVGMGKHGTPIEDDWKRHRRPKSLEGLLERAIMFPKKPKVKIGDGVVLYAAGRPRVIFAAGEFTSHPYLGPDSDYSWLVDVAWDEDATLPLVRYGVLLSDVGVDGKSVRQQSHIRLSEEQYRGAVRALRRAKAARRGG